MLNNASKFALGLVGVGVIALTVADDKAALILMLALALAGGAIAYGLIRSVGADLAPFVAKDATAAATAVDPSDVPVASAGPLITAIGATLGVAGGALGPDYVLAGVLVAIVGAALWTFDTYRVPGELPERDIANVDNRLLGPLALPVGAFALTITIAYSLSRVLLATSETASWIIALIVAAIMLGILVLVAERRPSSRVLAVLGAVGLVATLAAGGAAASVGERDFHHHEHEHAVVDLTAQNIAFDRKVVSVPADEEVEIRFTNLDIGTFHNVGIYTDDEPGTPIFNGKPSARGTFVYKFESPDAGTYRYVCDFHPAMTGELRVSEASTGTEEGESH